MRSAIARVTIKIIELLGCIACFVTKIITDLESRRVFLRNQKYSREWSLLHNITWSSAGNTFANITYGGFSLITTLMLISRCIDTNSRPSLIEKIFLIVGMLCFFAIGGIVLAAFDQVPWELHDNSIILGCLSFFVALVMLFDLSDPMPRHVADTTQTDNEIITPQHQLQPPQQQSQNQQPQQIVTVSETDPSNTTSIGIQVKEPTSNPVIDEPSDAMKSSKLVKETQVQIQTQTQTLQSAAPSISDDIAKNGNYHRGDTIDFVQYQHLPQAEQPVFERVLMPEKKRPTFNKVSDTHKTAIVQTMHPDEYVIHDPATNYRRDNRSYSTMHYSQMPKYAAIQRQQISAYPQYLDHQSSYSSPLPPTNHSTSMRKLSRDYEHDDYERPPSKHTTKMTRLEDLSRYRDPAPEHYQHNHHQQQHQQQQQQQQQQPPMMVIRNYAQSMSMSQNRTNNATVASTSAHNLDDRRHHHSNDNSVYHRNGTRKHAGTPITQMNSSKNGCCTQSTDDEVDFRKMNSAMRIKPGFVQSVAKLWDQRAIENSGEFNTIV